MFKDWIINLRLEREESEIRNGLIVDENGSFIGLRNLVKIENRIGSNRGSLINKR